MQVFTSQVQTEQTEQTEQQSIFIFDLSGKRLLDTTLPTKVIEPAKFIAEDNQQSMSQKIEKFHAHITEQDVVGIKLDKFADGRSYSIAARLREAGYAGALHAMGDINQELVFMLRRVGFTHFHLPDPGACDIAPQVVTPFAGYYQAAQDGTRAPWHTQ